MENKFIYVPILCIDRLPEKSGIYYLHDPNGLIGEKIMVGRFDCYTKTFFCGDDAIHPDSWLEKQPMTIEYKNHNIEKDNWISCKRQLPLPMKGDNPYKVSEAVLLLVDDGEDEYIVSGFYSYEYKDWYDSKYESEVEAKFWQPLPSKPKKIKTMNKEIKFRAWDEEIMYYEGDHYHESGCYCKFIGVSKGKPIVEETCEDDSNYGKITVMEGLVLMQFTGLKDKKGKEIYEGDILLFHSKKWDGFTSEIREEVIWDNEGGCYMPFNSYLDETGCSMVDEKRGYEVIGNIYETPELLK
jgi:uncharacterized phage protein (TIGR01671 family)